MALDRTRIRLPCLYKRTFARLGHSRSDIWGSVFEFEVAVASETEAPIEIEFFYGSEDLIVSLRAWRGRLLIPIMYGQELVALEDLEKTAFERLLDGQDNPWTGHPSFKDRSLLTRSHSFRQLPLAQQAQMHFWSPASDESDKARRDLQDRLSAYVVLGNTLWHTTSAPSLAVGLMPLKRWQWLSGIQDPSPAVRFDSDEFDAVERMANILQSEIGTAKHVRRGVLEPKGTTAIVHRHADIAMLLEATREIASWSSPNFDAEGPEMAQLYYSARTLLYLQKDWSDARHWNRQAASVLAKFPRFAEVAELLKLRILAVDGSDELASFRP